MKIWIDREGCIECGSCMATCPEVFVLPPGDKSTIIEAHRKSDPAHGEVGDELAGCAQDAADLCPVEVIHVE